LSAAAVFIGHLVGYGNTRRLFLFEADGCKDAAGAAESIHGKYVCD
jgi:hypothetical protein